MNSQYANNRGSALLISMALMLMLTLVTLMSADRATTEIEMSFNETNSEQAFYLANAGLNHAVIVLNDSIDWRTGFVNEILGTGTYAVAVIDSVTQPGLLDTVRMLSTAMLMGAAANLEALIVPLREKPFQYAVFGYERLRMSGNSCTDSYNSDSGSYADTRLDSLASVGTNGEMWVRDNSSVSGDVVVAVGGTLDMDSSANVSGDVILDALARDTNIIPDSEFIWAENNNSAPAGFSGSGYSYSGDNLTINDNDTLVLSGGTYFFNDIVIRNNGSIQIAPGEKVKIYTTGHIDLSDYASMNPGGNASNLIVLADRGRLRLEENSEFSGAYMGSGATFRMRQSSLMYGSITVMREELKTDGSADDFGGCFHFDRSLLNYEIGEIKGMKMIAWRVI